MYHVRQENLPFVGSSHEFVGANHGAVNVSVFLLSAQPGKGPGPHRHPRVSGFVLANPEI
jgi:quercetin dioxygenase-like cupin family protein